MIMMVYSQNDPNQTLILACSVSSKNYKKNQSTSQWSLIFETLRTENKTSWPVLRLFCFVSDVGKYMAVIVELTLPSSTYATMALREAMKIDMNKGSQAKLTEIMNKSILAQKRKIENENGNGDNESDEAKKAKVTQDDE